MIDPKIKKFEEMLPISDLRNTLRSSNVNENYVFTKIEKRLIDLEEKVFKSKKTNTTTRSQQMLLLHSLGILDKIGNLEISKTKQAILLSALLNSSMDNIKDDLETISNIKKSDVHSDRNYEFLFELLNICGLKKMAQEIESKRNEIKR